MGRIIAGLWSRQSDSAVSLVPRATKAPRSGVLDQATLALVPLNLDGY
jgi:hypothetical protein